MATTARTRKATPTAKRCDGTVTLANGTKWGAYKFPTGQVYVSPGHLQGFGVTECAPSLAATYVRNA